MRMCILGTPNPKIPGGLNCSQTTFAVSNFGPSRLKSVPSSKTNSWRRAWLGYLMLRDDTWLQRKRLIWTQAESHRLRTRILIFFKFTNFKIPPNFKNTRIRSVEGGICPIAAVCTVLLSRSRDPCHVPFPKFFQWSCQDLPAKFEVRSFSLFGAISI